MRMTAMVVLLAAALPAAAEFAVVEDTETYTVYRERAHVIVLVDANAVLGVFEFAMRRSPEPGVSTLIRDKASRDAGVKSYWSRILVRNGKLVCEKMAVRPLPEFRQHVLEFIAAAPCRNGML